MSFRNISRPQTLSVLRTRSKKPTDEGLWQNIYPKQVAKNFKSVQKFAVENWVLVVVGLTAGIGAAVAGFYIGQKYSTGNIVKKFAKGAIDLLPKKLQTQVQKFM